jgi:hypothetical protein
VNPMKPATMQSAVEAYRKSARFSMVCQSIVSEVMTLATRALDDIEREDPWRAREVCDRIATDVAARVLQTIYENDAEIAYWKAQYERLVDQSVEMLSLMPARPMLIFGRDRPPRRRSAQQHAEQSCCEGEMTHVEALRNALRGAG